MSALKAALSDTWRGLIARRLWPVALLLIIAMAAVPLVLLSSPEAPPPPRADAAGDAAELAAQPLVQVASSAERERLRRVLGARRDPFKPTNQPKRRAAPSGDETSARAAADKPGVAATGGSSGGGSSAPTSPPTGGPGSPGPTPTPEPAGPAPSEPARTPGSITVRWGESSADKLERIDVDRLDAIPSLDAPALIYLGVTGDGKSAVFLLDAGLAVDGDARCRPSAAECQTIELRAGETAFIELEEQEGGATVQYQLDLIRIHGHAGERARASRRDADADARATRRLLRLLGGDQPVYRYDAGTGTLELTPDRP